MATFAEPLPEFFGRSRLLILNFADIPSATPAVENIAVYFAEMQDMGRDPKAPENRQAFNDKLLAQTGVRYLVSRYGEDRQSMLAGSSIYKEGRTIHLGVDIFARNLEPVLSPCDGVIIRIGREPEGHSFGNYLIIKPDDQSLPYVFLGHLGSEHREPGKVRRGDVVARLGDYHDNENGGWSRHLHFQLLSAGPAEDAVPVGYASRASFPSLSRLYPDPQPYMPLLCR